MVKLLREMSLDAAEGKGSLVLEKLDQLLSLSLELSCSSPPEIALSIELYCIDSETYAIEEKR